MILRSPSRSWLLVVCLLVAPGWVQGQLRMQLTRGARECAMCHLDWMSSFQLTGEYTLIEPPGRNIVREPDTCLGCHDASIDDSRRKVWLEHGHQTDIVPPADMNVPPELPLQQGRIVCSTCHSAHGVPERERERTLADVFFLRIPNDNGQLCTACHSDLLEGPQHGFHPVNKELAGGLPEILREGGAHLGKDGQLVCTSCHLPHGSQQDALLALSPDANTFCLSCHQSMSPGMWQDGHAHTHPLTATIDSPTKREAISTLGTRIGENDQLVCSSCHKMHHAPGRDLLADVLTESRLCLQCHQDQKTLLDTVHNLAHSAPEAKNTHGQTVEQMGSCSACHGVHQPARNFETTSLDPTGTCATCHQHGQCAENVPLLTNDHPMPSSVDAALEELIRKLVPDHVDHQGITCFTCHDPHDNPHRAFLREAPDQLCGHCHSGQMSSLAGVHDFTELTEAVNARGLTPQESGKCGYCHAVHGAGGPALWAAEDVSLENANDLCLNCHLAGDLAAHTRADTLRHPSGAGMNLERIPRDHWPLYDEEAHASPQGVLACATCHDVHGDSTKSVALLRHDVPAGRGNWCMACHTDVSSIVRSMHRDQELAALVERMNPPGQIGRCAPCHKVHQSDTPVEHGMWAAALGSDAYPLDMQQCLGCHSETGGATTMSVTVHPTVPMSNAAAPGEPGFLPLIDEEGNMGATGRITCQTCHLPHGRHPGHGYPDVDESIPSEELARLGSLVRPYRTPNICSDCHGLEGLSNFLYYHFPEKRFAHQSR